MKSMCHDARRNSPSVAARRPTSSCFRTISRIASSSTSRRASASMRPAAKSSRAACSRAGRSRLPTWSARKGGFVRRPAATAVGASSLMARDRISVEDQPVTVDGFDVRRPRFELPGVERADAAAEAGAVEAAELHAVSRADVALVADDAYGKQAAPASAHRALRAFVHDQAAGDALAEAEPQLERRLAGGGRGEARPASRQYRGQRR